jgi:UDPglucose--hexose-1-phosphate uridylyltransferase
LAERRYDLLSDRWVIVSPQRVLRPWQGEETDDTAAQEPDWRPDCYLCPRNQRASGVSNPDYQGLLVFDNDFPALDDQPVHATPDPLLRQQAVTGRCRVICYHHQHDRTLGTLRESELGRVVDVWAEQHTQLGSGHDWVQIFENRGRMMGCSSDHPHGQIWASNHLPTLPATEDRMQRTYYETHRSPLLLDYAHRELKLGDRVVSSNSNWLVVVPWWAAWPFETLLLPLQPLPDFSAMGDPMQKDLTAILHQLLRAYDGLFAVAMPYSMGWHGRGRSMGDHWQLHAHFYPPLLRSATVRKFMVGYEMLAEAQRDLTPEDAAARLRQCLTDKI